MLAINPKPLTGLLLLLVLGACDRSEGPDESFRLGTLERDRYDLVASADEPIVGVDVERGASVAPGTVLVRLDDRRIRAALESAESTVARWEARLRELRRGGRSERRDEARARVAAAESELDQARLDLERAERLVADAVAPQSELDRARTLVATRQEELEATRAGYRELRVGATDEELAQAEAELTAAQAEVRRLEVDLERLTVRAPVAATVEALPYERGELPGAGATVVVLAAASPPWARVHVPQDARAASPVGTPARLRFDGSEASWPGCVRFVAADATFTPYYSLSDHDRHRLAYVTEVSLLDEPDPPPPSGTPVRVWIGDPESRRHADRCPAPTPSGADGR